MKFEHFRTLIIVLLVMVLAIAVYGAMAIPEGTALYTKVIIGDCLLMGFTIGLMAAFGKCPHCGTHLYLKTLRLRKCPRCKKNLFGEVARTGRRLK